MPQSAGPFQKAIGIAPTARRAPLSDADRRALFALADAIGRSVAQHWTRERAGPTVRRSETLPASTPPTN